MTSPANSVLLFEVSGVHANVTAPDEGAKYCTADPPSGYLSAGGTGGTGGLQSSWGNIDPAPLYVAGPNWGNRPAAYYGGNYSPTARHNDGTNYLAADDHVKFLRPTQVSTGGGVNNATDYQDQAYVGESTGANNMTLNGSGTPYVLTMSNR